MNQNEQVTIEGVKFPSLAEINVMTHEQAARWAEVASAVAATITDFESTEWAQITTIEGMAVDVKVARSNGRIFTDPFGRPIDSDGRWW